AVCLLQHKYKVDFLTDRSLEAELAIKQHAEDIHEATGRYSVALESLSFIDQVEDAASYLLAIIHNKENLQEKISVLHDLEDTIDSDLPILINFESYSLSELQEACLYPGRLLGCNWAYPAHTTY